MFRASLCGTPVGDVISGEIRRGTGAASCAPVSGARRQLRVFVLSVFGARILPIGVFGFSRQFRIMIGFAIRIVARSPADAEA